MRRRLVLFAGACLVAMPLAWSAPVPAAAGSVWIALSEPGGVYAETAAAVQAELERGGARPEIVVRPWRELTPGTAPPRLIVAIGVGALRGLAETDSKVPLLATLVPRTAYQRIADGPPRSGRPLSAVWLDQPLSRQLDLLTQALPSRHRIGVLLGPESRPLEAELLRAAGERNLEIVLARPDSAEQLSPAVQRVLEDADALLALPDPQIYNGATIQNLLTAAYRQRVPLIGFSPAYVKAGAMLSIYSTPQQVGTQTGEIARLSLAGRPLPPAQGPRAFSIGLNADVARSLGIVFDDEAPARWTERLRREGPP